VRYFALLRELLDDAKEEEYKVKDGTMLMDLLLDHIPRRHSNASKGWKERLFETERDGIKLDKDGTPSLKGYYLILINGISYRSVLEEGKHPGLRYKLKDEDEIAILPPVGGG
jgi:molybdopterin converting factor small subunit